MPVINNNNGESNVSNVETGSEKEQKRQPKTIRIRVAHLVAAGLLAVGFGVGWIADEQDDGEINLSPITRIFDRAPNYSDDAQLTDPVLMEEVSGLATQQAELATQQAEMLEALATSTPDVATPTPDVATSTPDVATPTPDVATPTPDKTTPTPDVATPTVTPIAEEPKDDKGREKNPEVDLSELLAATETADEVSKEILAEQNEISPEMLLDDLMSRDFGGPFQGDIVVSPEDSIEALNTDAQVAFNGDYIPVREEDGKIVPKIANGDLVLVFEKDGNVYELPVYNPEMPDATDLVVINEESVKMWEGSMNAELKGVRNPWHSETTAKRIDKDTPTLADIVKWWTEIVSGQKDIAGENSTLIESISVAGRILDININNNGTLTREVVVYERYEDGEGNTMWRPKRYVDEIPIATLQQEQQGQEFNVISFSRETEIPPQVEWVANNTGGNVVITQNGRRYEFEPENMHGNRVDRIGHEALLRLKGLCDKDRVPEIYDPWHEEAQIIRGVDQSRLDKKPNQALDEAIQLQVEEWNAGKGSVIVDWDTIEEYENGGGKVFKAKAYKLNENGEYEPVGTVNFKLKELKDSNN